MKNDTEVSKELKSVAVGLGLCKEWQKDWRDEDKHSMCEMYVRGIDFCISNDYPSAEYMKENFDGIMQEHNIYVDDHKDIKVNGKGVYRGVINGNSEINIDFSGFKIVDLYVRHNSKVNITIGGLTKVHVSVYDNAVVNMRSRSILSQGFIKKFSYKCLVYANDVGIKIREYER